MYRLGELSDERRRRLGWALLVGGTALMVLGVFMVHNFGLGAEDFDTSVIGGLLERLPLASLKWFKAVGYLIVFAASQLMLAGAALLWVLNQPMTWARATFAALLTWLEMVVIFGIVPSEWLNFSQTDLEWSFQDVLFQVPSALVLGNEIEVTTGALKDAISGGYNVAMLAAAGVLAYQIQRIKEGRPASAAPEQPVSPYGRPLVEPRRRDAKSGTAEPGADS